jgi:hypothetical protein
MEVWRSKEGDMLRARTVIKIRQQQPPTPLPFNLLFSPQEKCFFSKLLFTELLLQVEGLCYSRSHLNFPTLWKRLYINFHLKSNEITSERHEGSFPGPIVTHFTNFDLICLVPNHNFLTTGFHYCHLSFSFSLKEFKILWDSKRQKCFPKSDFGSWPWHLVPGGSPPAPSSQDGHCSRTGSIADSQLAFVNFPSRELVSFHLVLYAGSDDRLSLCSEFCFLNDTDSVSWTDPLVSPGLVILVSSWDSHPGFPF